MNNEISSLEMYCSTFGVIHLSSNNPRFIKSLFSGMGCSSQYVICSIVNQYLCQVIRNCGNIRTHWHPLAAIRLPNSDMYIRCLTWSFISHKMLCFTCRTKMWHFKRNIIHNTYTLWSNLLGNYLKEPITDTLGTPNTSINPLTCAGSHTKMLVYETV